MAKHSLFLSKMPSSRKHRSLFNSLLYFLLLFFLSKILGLFLFTIFYNCFFLKNKNNKEKTRHFYFIFVLKNTTNTKFKKQELFSKNTKIVFFVFKKTVFKNSFQNKKLNMSLFVFILFYSEIDYQEIETFFHP